jgi:hypothetical protein
MANFIRKNPKIFSPKLIRNELLKELRQFRIRRKLKKSLRKIYKQSL